MHSLQPSWVLLYEMFTNFKFFYQLTQQ